MRESLEVSIRERSLRLAARGHGTNELPTLSTCSKNTTEALDLRLTSSISDIVTPDFEEAIVLGIEPNSWYRGLAPER